jgi:hypothetical protein
MSIPAYLAQEMHSLDPRLFVDFNDALGLWEVRLYLKESECNLEGVPWLEAKEVFPIGGFGNVVELRPTSLCVKRVQTLAGQYRPFDMDVINYLKKIDVHRWGRLKDWLDFVDNIGKGEIESKRALSSESRVKQIKADWNSAHVERRFVDYGHHVCV